MLARILQMCKEELDEFVLQSVVCFTKMTDRLAAVAVQAVV